LLLNASSQANYLLERVYPIAGILFMVFLLVSVQLGVDFFFSSFVCSSNFFALLLFYLVLALSK